MELGSSEFLYKTSRNKILEEMKKEKDSPRKKK